MAAPAPATPAASASGGVPNSKSDDKAPPPAAIQTGSGGSGSSGGSGGSGSATQAGMKVTSQTELEAKFATSLKPVLYRAAVMAPPIFEPGWSTLNQIAHETRVLVVGAGSVGCEVLKGLILSGFQDITVVDPGRVEMSGLNRQCLYRVKDIGSYKAEIAAAVVNKRCQQPPQQQQQQPVVIQFRTKRIQEFGPRFFQSFHICILGLGSSDTATRSWVNRQLCDLVRYDESGEVDWDTIVPMIDASANGMNSHIALSIPHVTACHECIYGDHTRLTGGGGYGGFYDIRRGHHLYADVPRQPEDCIQYALLLAWPTLVTFTTPNQYLVATKPTEYDEKAAGKEWEPPNAVRFDPTDFGHITWVWRRAQERAKKYHLPVESITFTHTQQIVGSVTANAVPSSAMMAAACVTEALKYRSFLAWRLNNYLYHSGGSNQSETVALHRFPDCSVCAKPTLVTLDRDTATLADVVDIIKRDLKITEPIVHTATTYYPVYDGRPRSVTTDPTVEAEKLKKRLCISAGAEPISHNDVLNVSCRFGGVLRRLIVRYKAEFPVAAYA